jgi:hypothetical protein
MPPRRLALALLLGLALAGATASHAQSPMGAFCGTRAKPPRTYAHVVWIWMENHSYGQIVGSPYAPFINSLIAACGLATNFHNITHVSLPNYIGAVSGLSVAELQPLWFDCSPSPRCSTAADSIFARAPSWKAYEESMTTNCRTTGFVGYAVRHNPPPYFTALSECATFDVPYTELQTDLDNDTLPAFSFITPNTVDDMHDGADPAAIEAGDRWLQNEVPKILNSVAYQSGTTAVFVTFDEGEAPGFNFGEDCATNTTDESCHIATIVISPSTPPGTISARLFNHYSLLKTTMKLLGMRGHLGKSRSARNMRHPFRL